MMRPPPEAVQGRSKQSRDRNRAATVRERFPSDFHGRPDLSVTASSRSRPWFTASNTTSPGLQSRRPSEPEETSALRLR